MTLLLAACGLGKPALITRDGQLAPCNLPHCVSSLMPADSNRYIEPIRYAGTRDAARNALVRVIRAMEGARIVTLTEDYVHVEFTSKIARFVDDLELVMLEGTRKAEVRSSSRVGVYDFDLNRERLEKIRAAFDALQP
ncbi:MAG TPA: DUF1499 domain-containing protein [Solimonas sp.]|nr:DUF1499 domain-containing protein [Solimonas sp.]